MFFYPWTYHHHEPTKMEESRWRTKGMILFFKLDKDLFTMWKYIVTWCGRVCSPCIIIYSHVMLFYCFYRLICLWCYIFRLNYLPIKIIVMRMHLFSMLNNLFACGSILFTLWINLFIIINYLFFFKLNYLATWIYLFVVFNYIVHRVIIFYFQT